MKTKYTVRKSKTDDMWVVWMDVQEGRGISCKGVFKDISRRRCYKAKKELERKADK